MPHPFNGSSSAAGRSEVTRKIASSRARLPRMRPQSARAGSSAGEATGRHPRPSSNASLARTGQAFRGALVELHYHIRYNTRAAAVEYAEEKLDTSGVPTGNLTAWRPLTDRAEAALRERIGAEFSYQTSRGASAARVRSRGVARLPAGHDQVRRGGSVPRVDRRAARVGPQATDRRVVDPALRCR